MTPVQTDRRNGSDPPAPVLKAAITFDFHNTIAHCASWFQLEIETLVSEFLRWQAGKRGAKPTPALAIAADAAYRRLRRSIHAHGHELSAERAIAAILDELGISPPMADIERGVADLMAATLHQATPVDGAVETIAMLREAGARLGIVSSAVYHPFLLWTLDRFGLPEAFDVVITSASAGFYKSRPEIYWHALAALGAAPERSIHVGDSLTFDIEGARRAGMRTAWLNGRGDHAAATDPDLTVNTLIGAAPLLLDMLQTGREPSTSSSGSGQHLRQSSND